MAGPSNIIVVVGPPSTGGGGGGHSGGSSGSGSTSDSSAKNGTFDWSQYLPYRIDQSKVPYPWNLATSDSGQYSIQMITDQQSGINSSDYNITDDNYLKYRVSNQGDHRLGTVLYKNSRGQYSLDVLRVSDSKFVALRGTTAVVTDVTHPDYSFAYKSGFWSRSYDGEPGYYSISNIISGGPVWGPLTGNGSGAAGTLQGRCVASCVNYMYVKKYRNTTIKMYINEEGKTVITNSYTTFKYYANSTDENPDYFNQNQTSTVTSNNYVFYVVIAAAGGGGYESGTWYSSDRGGAGQSGAVGIFRVDLTGTNQSNPVEITLAGPGAYNASAGNSSIFKNGAGYRIGGGIRGRAYRDGESGYPSRPEVTAVGSTSAITLITSQSGANPTDGFSEMSFTAWGTIKFKATAAAGVDKVHGERGGSSIFGPGNWAGQGAGNTSYLQGPDLWILGIGAGAGGGQTNYPHGEEGGRGGMAWFAAFC